RCSAPLEGSIGRRAGAAADDNAPRRSIFEWHLSRSGQSPRLSRASSSSGIRAIGNALLGRKRVKTLGQGKTPVAFYALKAYRQQRDAHLGLNVPPGAHHATGDDRGRAGLLPAVRAPAGRATPRPG